MSTLYIEPFSGLAGDMLLSAFCGLADDYHEVMHLPEKLNLPDGKVEVQTLNKNGIVCKHVHVIDLNEKASTHSHGHDDTNEDQDRSHGHTHTHEHTHSHSHTHDHVEGQHHSDEEHSHGHRHLSDINKLIDEGDITDGAKKIAREIFQIIGKSESKVHDIPLEKIHFHEVSAVDSIIDIVGCAVLLDKLKVTKTYADAVCLGQGIVKTQHGMLPVPAPATTDILQGIPTYKGNEKGEKTTPTGAAVLKYLNPDFNPPAMISRKIAYGPGMKDFTNANVVRVSLVQASGDSQSDEQMYLVETQIDDAPAEFMGSDFQQELLQQGATDFYYTPVQMKKGRPGFKLSVLTEEKALKETSNFLLEQTSTIGVRYYPVFRNILVRNTYEVDTTYGAVKVKEVIKPSGRSQHKIEYESLNELSKKHKIPVSELRDILQPLIMNKS